MASLLDLTAQGDVATISDDAYLSRSLKLMDPQQLYQLWDLSSFFVGEERVTTQFSGLVMAYEDEQEEAFLPTQQVDEARHMQFFDRYYREVPGYGETSISGRLELARRDVSDAFIELFDGEL